MKCLSGVIVVAVVVWLWEILTDISMCGAYEQSMFLFNIAVLTHAGRNVCSVVCAADRFSYIHFENRMKWNR